MDNNAASVATDGNPPVTPACAGCLIKYSFLGYADNAGKSSIPASIDVTAGANNTINQGTTITIDGTNNHLWVPITGPDGNIMAEINAMGQSLGVVTSAFYTHTSTVREDASKKLYLNRSMTIIPQNQPTSTVNVRFYITTAELNALIGATNSQGQSSMVTGIGSLKILKNNDATPQALTAATAIITPTSAESYDGTTNGGYVLQADISSFSSFYFENPDMITLPLQLISFKGTLQENAAMLKWETTNENNTSHFEVERSINGQQFEKIGTVSASGNTSTTVKYSYTDYDVTKQSSAIVYYRLKLADKDAKYSYSNIINLNIGQPSYPIVVYPNPVSDVLNLKVSLLSTQHIHVQVTDMQGRVLYRKTKLVRGGTEEININTKSWPAQSYSIRVTDNNNKVLINKKIIKM